MRKAIDAAIIRDGKLLLVRKRETWILPGGKPEEGETDLECLAREIKEETGIVAEDFSYYREFRGISPHKRDEITVRVYLATGEGDPQPSAEIGACKWVDNLDAITLSELTEKIIRSLQENGYL